MPAVAVGVAIVAAILGFFILKQFGDDGTKKTGTEAGAGGSAAATDPAPGATDADGNPITVPVDPTATAAPIVTAAPVAVARNSFTVVVANGSKVAKAAGAMKTALEREGYTTLPATDVLESVITPPITVTRIMFAPTFEGAAADVSKMLGGIVPEPITVLPVGPDSATANVIIVLGTDLAKKPLPGGSAPVQVGTDPAATAATLAPVAGSPNETTTTVA